MIEVLATMPLNSVQDPGRAGTRQLGIAPGGAMDRLALRIGNLLLGNPEEAAAIEVQLAPMRLRLTRDTHVAITGAPCNAVLDGRRLPPWWLAPARAGAVLELAGMSSGQRSYVCVSGGIDVPLAARGRGTQMRDGFGGHEGRALRAGDRLEQGRGAALVLRDSAGFGLRPPSRILAAPQPVPPAAPDEVTVRVIPAAEFPEFDAPSREALFGTPWTITRQSDRQGYRLEGRALNRTVAGDMRSHGIVPGVIQVPPSGQPLIQLADANSAGGYPKIGVVIEPDLWRIAQARPGQVLRFAACDRAGAIAAEQETRRMLEMLARLIDHNRTLEHPA